MSIKVRDGLGVLELHFWWENAGTSDRIWPRDPQAARAILARLSASGHEPMLRRLAREHLSVDRIDVGDLLETMASWLVKGKLRIARAPIPPLPARDLEGEEPPAPPPLWRAPEPEKEAPAPIEEALPPEEVDGLAQARALILAAQSGAPFCEQCVRAKAEPEDTRDLDQAAQARALTEAAKDGTPFCEPCAKAKKR
ncbi:Hypothetical protein A7982_08805 [Minicystis rosea]|nr:Hypothetical protein A7982_08805 [Minicystis rosea]